MLSTKQILGPFDGKTLYLVDYLLTLLVAFSSIAFRIFIGQHRSGGLEHGG